MRSKNYDVIAVWFMKHQQKMGRRECSGGWALSEVTTWWSWEPRTVTDSHRQSLAVRGVLR